jgi:hypothetical protein
MALFICLIFINLPVSRAVLFHHDLSSQVSTLDQDALDLIQAKVIITDGLSPDGIVGTVIELRCARRIAVSTSCGVICCACSIVPPLCR